MNNPAAAPIWEASLRKRLQHAGVHFEIDFALRSDAPRLVLFGPSGAGKTQVLRMLAGISRPDAGRVRVLGDWLFDADAGIDIAPQQRRLACVFQDYALFPHLSVRQNIAFGRRRGWRNPPRGHHDAVVERWIDAFALGAVATLLPQQLSGGQRQRTALARALAQEPVALLLDEPFAALDRGLRDRLRAELSQLQAELRLPMILVSHDEDDLRLLADEVVLIDNGRVVQGTPAPAAAAAPAGVGLA